MKTQHGTSFLDIEEDFLFHMQAETLTLGLFKLFFYLIELLLVLESIHLFSKHLYTHIQHIKDMIHTSGDV